MKKRLLSLFLALIMVLSMIPVTGAEEITVVDSGSCGEDMTWTLTSDGLLTISGTGEMEYEDGGWIGPWYYDHSDEIHSVVVEEGVVSVGSAAFMGLDNLVSVSLPATLEDFDTGDTFNQTPNLETITVAEGNQNFCSVDGVLYSKDMRYLWKVPAAMTGDFVVPESVTWLYAFVFESCTNLNSVTFTGNAPDIFYVAFQDAVVDCFYPEDNPTWTKNLLQNYGGTLTWNGEPAVDMQLYMQRMAYADPEGTTWQPMPGEDPFPVETFHVGGDNPHRFLCGTSLDDLVPVNEVYVSSGSKYLTLTGETYEYEGETGTLYWIEGEGDVGKKGRLTYYVDELPYEQTFYLTIPIVGCFSDGFYAEYNWLGGWTLSYDSTEDYTFWILREQGFPAETEFVDCDDTGIVVESVEIGNDLYGCRVTVPAGTLVGDRWINVQIVHDGQPMSGGWSVRMRDTAPKGELFHCFDSGGANVEDGYFPAEISLNQIEDRYFFYQLNGEMLPVVSIEPVAGSPVSVSEDCADHNGYIRWDIGGYKLGTHELKIKVAGSDTVYLAEVECVLPEFGVYLADELSAQAIWRNRVIPYSVGQENKVWLIFKDGMTGEETISVDPDPGLSWRFVDTEEGKAAEITIPDTLTTEEDIRITVARKGMVLSFDATLDPQDGSFGWAEPNWSEEGWSEPAASISGAPVLQAGTEIPSYLYLMKDGEKLRFDAVWSMDEDLVVDEETDVNGETLYMLSCDKVGTYWLGMRAADTGILYYMQLECVLPGIGCYSSPAANAEDLYLGENVPFNAGTEKTFWIVSDLGFTGEETISLPSSSYRGSELEFEFVDRTDSNTWKALQVTVKDTVETSGHIKLELTGGSDIVMGHMITINMVESTPQLSCRQTSNEGAGWYEDFNKGLNPMILEAGWNLTRYLYYGVEGSQKRVTSVEAVNPEDVTIRAYKDREGVTYWGIQAHRFGEIELLVKVEGDKNTYRCTMEAVLSIAGLFTQPEMKEEFYCWNHIVPFVAGTETVFWMALARCEGTETLTSSNPLVTIEHVEGETGIQMAKVTVDAALTETCTVVLKAETENVGVGISNISIQATLIESSPRIWRVIGEVQNDTWQAITEYGMSSMLYTPSSDGYFLYYGSNSKTAERITHMELVDPDQAMIYTHKDSDGLPVYQVFTESAAPIPVRLQVQGDDTVYESALQFDLPEISYFRAPLFNGSNFYTGPVEYEAGVGSEFWILTQTGLKGTEPVTMDDRLTWEWVDTEQEGVKAIHVIIPATLSGTQFCEATVKHEGGTTHMSFALVDDTPQIQWQHVGNLGDELYFRSGRDMAEVMQVENGTDISYALYYGPYYDPQPIVDVQLPATAKIKVEKLNTTLPAFHIQTAGCETITATVTTADGNTYSVPIQVTLPFIGLYCEAERTEDNLIEDWIFDYTPGGDETVYILCEDGSFDNSTQFYGDMPEGASWEMVQLDDGNLAIKITADAMRGDLSESYRLTGKGFNWKFELTFNDLTTDAAYAVYQLREYVNGIYGDPVTELTHGYATTKTYGLFRGDTRITDFTWSVAEGDKNAVTLVKDKATGNFDLTMNTYDPFVLEFEADDVAGEIPHVADNLLSQTFTIDGEDYVLALCQDRRGQIEDMSPYMGFGAYGFSEEDPDEVADERTFIVAMLQDYRMGEDPVFAPADIQSKIESVTFGVEDDDNGVFVLAQQPQKTADGWYQGELHLKQIAGDGYFTATVKLRDEEEPVKLRFYGHIGMTQETVIDCEEEGIDTVAKLNKLIANLDIGSNERVIINLIPGHTYTGTIYASTEGDWDLVGQVDEDGRCTTIVGGIVMEERMGFIDSICFIAPDSNEETVAISHDGGYAYTVNNSVFYGYDVAVDCTEDGYTLPKHNNLFVNNGVAVRLDCAKMNSGNANEGMGNNTFIGNGTALDVRGLPSYLASEDFEVTVCDFLNNDLDISVPDGEVWFCHRNYFGIAETMYSQQCAAKISGQVYTEIGLSDATAAEFHGYRSWWAETLRLGGVLDDSGQLSSGQVAADDTMQKVLNFLSGVKIKMALGRTSVTPGARSTVVRNSDAKTLWLSEAALKELQQELAMQVLDDDGNPVGTWIFPASNDPNGNTQNYFDHTLTAEELQDGSLEITVQDSAALQNCQSSLQIQVDTAWQMAAVTDLAGNSVTVQWDDAKHTVTFPVAEGGAYTVTEVVTQTAVITVEDAEALSGDTITLPVTIAENPGFAAFNLELVYDSALELLSVEVGNLLQGEDLVINGNYVLWYGMNNVTGDGDLLELTFKVPDDCAAGDYTVAVKLTDDQPKNLTNVASKAVPVTFRDATVHVEEFLLGDVNEDRGVFTDDAVLLAQALVKAVTLSQRQTKAADVDFDGDLTAADLVKLVQYLLGNIQDLRENLAPMLAATAPKLMMSMQMYAGTTFRPSLTAGTGTPEVSVDQVQGLCGETVLVPVRIKNNAGLSGFTLDVDYDTDAMEFIGVEAGEIVTSANKMYCNAGRVVMVNSSAYHGDGILFYLVFRVAADAEKTLQPVRVSLPKNDVRDFVHASKNMPVFRSGGVTPTLAIPTEAAMETASNGALTLTYDLELAKSVDVNQVHVSVSLYDGDRMVYFGTLEVPENATTITVPYTGAFDSGKLYVLDQQYAPMASALRLEVAS